MQKRKLIAVLITLILMVSVFSISAFATDLQGLTISDASSIDPAFSAGVYKYTITVPDGVTAVNVDATVAEDTGATVEVIGADDISSGDGIFIIVTDKDKTTKQTYYIDVANESTLAEATTVAAATTTQSQTSTSVPVYYVGIFLLLIVLAFGVGYLIAHGVTKSKYEDVERPSSMPIIPQSQSKIRFQTTSNFDSSSHRATGHQVPRPVAPSTPIIPAEKELSKKEQKKLEKQKAKEEQLRLKQQQELEARLAKEHENEEKEKAKQAKLEAKAAKKNKGKKATEPEKPAELPMAAPMPVPSFVQGIDEPVAASNPVVLPEPAPVVAPEPTPVVVAEPTPAVVAEPEPVPVIKSVEVKVAAPEPTVELSPEPAVELPVEPAIELPVEPAIEAPSQPKVELPSFSFSKPDDFVMGSADDVELSEKDKKRLRKKEEEDAKKAEEKEQKKKKSIFAKSKAQEEEEVVEEEDDFEGWQEEIPDSLAGFGFTAAAKLSDEFVQSADD